MLLNPSEKVCILFRLLLNIFTLEILSIDLIFFSIDTIIFNSSEVTPKLTPFIHRRVPERISVLLSEELSIILKNPTTNN